MTSSLYAIELSNPYRIRSGGKGARTAISHFLGWPSGLRLLPVCQPLDRPNPKNSAGTEFVSIGRSLLRTALRIRHRKSMSEMNAETAKLQNLILGKEIVDRIDELGAISETKENLTRIFLTREHRAAAELILGWRRWAGMA